VTQVVDLESGPTELLADPRPVDRTDQGAVGHQFRRDYADWERLTVEYALKRFTQRDVASVLGVGLSTVNRWAQHTLTYSED